MLALVVVVAAAAGAILWAWAEGGADERALSHDPSPGGTAPARDAAELVARGEPRGDPGPDVVQEYAPPPRTEAREQVEAEPEPAPPEPPPTVFGSVFDEIGRPVEGVGVRLADGGSSGRAVRGWQIETRRGRAGDEELITFLSDRRQPFGRPPGRGAVTDADGAFELAGADAREGGELVFAEELYVGDPPRQAVVADGAHQSLLLPRRPPTTPLVGVNLSDADTGARVDPDRVEAELLELLPQPRDADRHAGPLPPLRGRRHPRPDQVYRLNGRVELELWPGRWRVSVAGERSSTAELELVVPLEGPWVEVEARVTTFDARDGWELLDPAALGGPALEADPTQGFDEFGPEHYFDRELGNKRADGHFRRTLRFGPGDVRSARLELDIEAASGMAHNDALHLEFRSGAPRFGFSTSLSELNGAPWRPPRRRCFLLDLGALPGRDGPVSLLDELADGRLDVYLADDTAVHGLRLFVSR